MATCNQQGGNPSLYGLGIRIAFYSLWLGTLLVSYLIPSSVPNLRLLQSFFMLSTFFALILQSSWGAISPVDAYITLLLTSATFYTFIPIYIWKVLSMCNPFWDPTRWPRVPMTGFYKRWELLTMTALAAYTTWLFGSGVGSLPTCGDQGEGKGYGFFFTQAPIDAGLFVAVNIVFAVELMIGGLISLGVDLGIIFLPRWRRRQERRFEREMDRFEMRGEEFPWKSPLQLLRAISDTIVFTIVIVAIEFTIQWNNLTPEVSDISTSAQLIPLFVVAGFLLHALYVWFNPDHDKVIRRALHPKRHGGKETRRGKGRSRSSSDNGGGGGGFVGVAVPGRPYIPGGGGGAAANVVHVEPGP
ncbi:hypothetical protein V8F33_004977 [Rhypophila sp. PSN 637]